MKHVFFFYVAFFAIIVKLRQLSRNVKIRHFLSQKNAFRVVSRRKWHVLRSEPTPHLNLLCQCQLSVVSHFEVGAGGVKNHPVLYIFKMGLKTGRSEMCLKIQKDFVRKQFAERMRRWQQRKESPTKKLKSNYPEGCSKKHLF